MHFIIFSICICLLVYQCSHFFQVNQQRLCNIWGAGCVRLCFGCSKINSEYVWIVLGSWMNARTIVFWMNCLCSESHEMFCFFSGQSRSHLLFFDLVHFFCTFELDFLNYWFHGLFALCLLFEPTHHNVQCIIWLFRYYLRNTLDNFCFVCRCRCNGVKSDIDSTIHYRLLWDTTCTGYKWQEYGVDRRHTSRICSIH